MNDSELGMFLLSRFCRHCVPRTTVCDLDRQHRLCTDLYDRGLCPQGAGEVQDARVDWYGAEEAST